MTGSDCCQSMTWQQVRVTRDDPGLDLDTIAACLDVQYDLRVSDHVSSPRLRSQRRRLQSHRRGRDRLFPQDQVRAGRRVRADRPLGIVGARNSQRACAAANAISELWCSCDGRSLVLYPFIAGKNAMTPGWAMTNGVSSGRRCKPFIPVGWRRSSAAGFPSRPLRFPQPHWSGAFWI